MISIHAPRMGSDILKAQRQAMVKNISIHAPRMGSDSYHVGRGLNGINCNPRSPHGERRIRWALPHQRPRFQSTLPAWGATKIAPMKGADIYISIHAPRMGSDMPAVGHIMVGIGISIHAPRMGSDVHSRYR